MNTPSITRISIGRFNPSVCRLGCGVSDQQLRFPCSAAGTRLGKRWNSWITLVLAALRGAVSNHQLTHLELRDLCSEPECQCDSLGHSLQFPL